MDVNRQNLRVTINDEESFVNLKWFREASRYNSGCTRYGRKYYLRLVMNSDNSKSFVQGLTQAASAAKLREEMEGARRVTRGMFDAAFKMPPKREHEDFVVGRYLAHRGTGKQEEESCELAFRELASAMGLPFEE